MIKSKLYISNNAIEIRGEGLGVNAQEIQRVAGLFKKMFTANPEIRIRGTFPPESMKTPFQGRSDDLTLEQTQLVLLVGRYWVDVLLERGLGTITVAPSKGRVVVVRLLIPKG